MLAALQFTTTHASGTRACHPIHVIRNGAQASCQKTHRTPRTATTRTKRVSIWFWKGTTMETLTHVNVTSAKPAGNAQDGATHTVAYAAQWPTHFGETFQGPDA